METHVLSRPFLQDLRARFQADKVLVLYLHLLQAVGSVFLIAALFKVSDYFFVFKVLHSPYYLSACIADVIVGCCLIVNPMSRVNSIVAAAISLAYLIFHLTNPSVRCDCFGQGSEWISDNNVVAFLFVSLCLTMSGACTRILSVPTALSFRESLRRSLVLFGTATVCLVVYRASLPDELIYGVVAQTDESDAQGTLSGKIEVRNTSGVPVKIVGSGNSKCEGALFLHSSEPISPGGKSQYDCFLPGKFFGGYAMGETKVIVEINQNTQNCRLRWICKLN